MHCHFCGCIVKFAVILNITEKTFDVGQLSPHLINLNQLQKWYGLGIAISDILNKPADFSKNNIFSELPLWNIKCQRYWHPLNGLVYLFCYVHQRSLLKSVNGRSEAFEKRMRHKNWPNILNVIQNILKMDAEDYAPHGKANFKLNTHCYRNDNNKNKIFLSNNVS